MNYYASYKLASDSSFNSMSTLNTNTPFYQTSNTTVINAKSMSTASAGDYIFKITAYQGSYSEAATST